MDYKVQDNRWHSKDYDNVPLDDFMGAVKKAIKNGYTLSLGGDVSVSGFSRENNCGLIPKYSHLGCYFFHEDYIKLKMIGFTVHKDAVNDLLKKFN